MPRRLPFLAILLCAVAAVPSSLHAAGPFPLRVHIYQTNEHPQYRNGALTRVDGDGRANLYENSQPRGLDFNFNCTVRVMTSSGFETYPARWLRKPQTLEIFVPTLGGKPGSGHTCELKVALKDFAYYRRNGAVETEPAAAFKAWMQKHNYDPEHGKNQPTGLDPTK